MTGQTPQDRLELTRTGIEGLDRVLGGGLTAERLYLVEGEPGSGKTTLALQFLQEGARRGEPVLYVTLSESEPELRGVARSHGWSLTGITIHELAPGESALSAEDQYTMFHPAEVELGETTQSMLAAFDRLRPTRAVFDSLSELRLLAGAPLRYRRQILALKQFFSGRQCTVLLLDDLTSQRNDLQVQSIAHGALRLEQLRPEFGGERRRLTVLKYRGMAFRGGFHDYVIRRGGLVVFPRLMSSDAPQQPTAGVIASKIPELDALLGGGLDRSTSTLIIGAPGTGKSTLASAFAFAAATNGEAVAMFLFDESVGTLLRRSAGFGQDLQPLVESGRVSITQVNPAELSPGEFADAIRRAVTEREVKLVVIDSLNGYLNAMPEERYLVIQLHELLTFLSRAGVVSILIGAHQGMIGSQMTAPVDASYLADSIVLMRYFEAGGEVRQAVSIVKKRTGAHERSIREMKVTAKGLHIGPPLREFRGILTGVPVRDES